MHLATQVTGRASPRTPYCGQTIWGGCPGRSEARIAWDWVDIGDGVVAMVDPLAIQTNVQLLHVDGRVMHPLEAALHINHIVRKLPWQQEVQRLLTSKEPAHEAGC